MTTMTGSQYLAHFLQAYGVTHVFFVPAAMIPALVRMHERGITCVTVHSEKAAAYMADGYARASHRPGVCIAQAIGAANLAAGLRDAHLACSPVIALTGGRLATTKYRHVYQEIDDSPIFEPLTKFNAQVDAVERLPDLLRQAFRTATTGSPGPAHLEIAGFLGQILEEDVNHDLIVEARHTACPAHRPEADAQDVAKALGVLTTAQRPVIVAGGGVAASDAQVELVELAQRLDIPVATSLNGKGSIAENHRLSVGVVGLYSRSCANRVVSEADVVFFVGSHTGSQVTNDWTVPPLGTTVIQLDIEAEELGRNYPNVVSLLGDARTVLRQLIEVPQAPRSNEAWLSRVRLLVDEWRTSVKPLCHSDAIPIRPERVCAELTRLLPADCIVVAETGHAGMWSAMYIELTEPQQTFIRAAGSLGWGLPAALGAKCAAPDRPVVCFSGDGGFYYHLAELETAARYGINVVIVVNNNHSYNQETELFANACGGRQTSGFEMWRFNEVNLADIAESLGCVGVRVERPDQIAPALQHALRCDRPAVVDVTTDIKALAPLAWTPS
ncbi:MAG: thiamine pyrophosphate-binding protein [Planctomycetota bacterium]